MRLKSLKRLGVERFHFLYWELKAANAGVAARFARRGVGRGCAVFSAFSRQKLLLNRLNSPFEKTAYDNYLFIYPPNSGYKYNGIYFTRKVTASPLACNLKQLTAGQ
jgi:hypothetical protein